MKILQWNIWWKECTNNLEEIIEELERFNADILCLQEVSYFENPDFLKPLNELYPYPAFAVADTLKNHTQGNAILSKYKIEKVRTGYIQQPLEEIRSYENEGRIYLECDYLINEKLLTIGTTHCSYTDKFKKTPAKDQEFDKLLEFLKRKKENFVFCGDLNATPASPYIKKISEILKNISPNFSFNTWTTKPFNHNNFCEKELNWRLDYIWGTEDIEMVKTEVLNTKLSDHLPIITEIKF